MAVAGVNFGTHFLVFRKLSFVLTERSRDGAYFALLAISVLGIAYFLLATTLSVLWKALRYQRVQRRVDGDDTVLPRRIQPMAHFAPVWMLFLCCFATCSGSTAAHQDDRADSWFDKRFG